MVPPRLQTTGRMALFAVCVLAAATIREGPSTVVNQAIIWVPTGVAVAGVWMLGLRAAWIVGVVTLAQRFLIGYSAGMAVPAAFGSTAEAMVGAVVLRRLDFRASLARLRDVGALFAAASLAPLASILISWGGRALFWNRAPFYAGWDGWWRMNALGLLTIVPLVVSWFELRRADLRLKRMLGTLLALAGIPALTFTVVKLVPDGVTGVLWLNLVLVAALYAAVRFGVRGATLVGSLAGITLAVATTRGFGPFVGIAAADRHVAIQLFELSFVAIPLSAGALIAERQSAQASGARSDDLLASLNRNVKEGLFRGTPELRLVYANRALAQLLGHDSSESVIGRSLAEAVDDPLRRSEIVHALATTGQWRNEEVRFRRADGGTFWGLLSVTAVRGADGEITHHDGAIADITARKELEEQFRQSQKMEAVGKLAGGVAHDFNNLLTVILGYADVLHTDAAQGSPARAHAAQVIEAASRASGLTRQLLAYSRQQVLSPRELDLAMVVDQMGEMLRRLIGEDIRLVIQHRDGACWVRVDRSQLEQVLLNLVVNARDAMRDGGTLTLCTARSNAAGAAHANSEQLSGPCATLSVHDTGSGMAPEVQGRVFDPFFTTKPPGEGTGLGLSTVYGIVKQSGGAVWFESEAGAGSTFWIALPSVPAAPEAEAATDPRDGGVRAATVLVVEDEPLVRGLVRSALELDGHRVLEAADGVLALQMWEQHAGAIDLVVTDIVMPNMGGRELARRLLALHPGVRLLFMSGYAEDARESGEFAGSAGDFLAKPFTPGAMRERVHALLGSAGPLAGTTPDCPGAPATT